MGAAPRGWRWPSYLWQRLSSEQKQLSRCWLHLCGQLICMYRIALSSFYLKVTAQLSHELCTAALAMLPLDEPHPTLLG